MASVAPFQRTVGSAEVIVAVDSEGERRSARGAAVGGVNPVMSGDSPMKRAITVVWSVADGELISPATTILPSLGWMAIALKCGAMSSISVVTRPVPLAPKARIHGATGSEAFHRRSSDDHNVVFLICLAVGLKGHANCI